MKKYVLAIAICTVAIFAAQSEPVKDSRDGINMPKESKEYMKMVNEAYQMPINRTVVKDSNESK